MFLSSVVVYLLTRKATFTHLSTEVINFATFFIPLFLYVPLALKEGANISITIPHFMIIFVLAFFCAYISNITSLKSIKYAPNPGYSLILSKSYVVFTTLFAVFFFKSHLTIKSGLAIIMIVGFSTLIVLGKTKTHKHSNSLWLPYAFVSFFGWGMLSIGTKYAFTIGINIYQRLIYIAILVSLFIAIEMVFRKTSVKNLGLRGIFVLLAIGLFAGLFNYFMMVALDMAPNIGYVNAINASSISMVTVFSALLFKDEFTFKKFLGVLGVTAGLVLLVL